MEKKVIREVLIGLILLICATLIILELNNNLFGRENAYKSSSNLFYNVDSILNDSIIPPGETWDENIPDYLRQEY